MTVVQLIVATPVRPSSTNGRHWQRLEDAQRPSPLANPFVDPPLTFAFLRRNLEHTLRDDKAVSYSSGLHTTT